MKYLAISDFDAVTSALNFSTLDYRVDGGCDVYTTKAAGADKKLYKDIEQNLESQYSSLLSLSASLSGQQARDVSFSLDLSRASPFGSFSQISSRRTFAYLIATLNASHPEYDFSQMLRPSDFQREHSLDRVMQTFDTMLTNLQPRQAAGPSTDTVSLSSLAHRPLDPRTHGALPRPMSIKSESAGITIPSRSAAQQAQPLETNPNSSRTNLAATTSSSPPQDSSMSTPWGPQLWSVIDQHMALADCATYRYAPEEDPFQDNEDGESAIWTFNYFFFNKDLKRVCYLYARGLSLHGGADDEMLDVQGSVTPSGAKTPTSVVSFHHLNPHLPNPDNPYNRPYRQKRSAETSGTCTPSPSDREVECDYWTAGSLRKAHDSAPPSQLTRRKQAKFWFGDAAKNVVSISDDDDDDNNDEGVKDIDSCDGNNRAVKVDDIAEKSRSKDDLYEINKERDQESDKAPRNISGGLPKTNLERTPQLNSERKTQQAPGRQSPRRSSRARTKG